MATNVFEPLAATLELLNLVLNGFFPKCPALAFYRKLFDLYFSYTPPACTLFPSSL